MNLKGIYKEIKNQGFPYENIRLDNNLGSITDSIIIKISLDKQEDWTNGIFNNSRYLIGFIFCTGQREKIADLYSFRVSINSTGTKIIQKNHTSPERLVKHINKQLEKIQERR